MSWAGEIRCRFLESMLDDFQHTTLNCAEGAKTVAAGTNPSTRGGMLTSRYNVDLPPGLSW